VQNDHHRPGEAPHQSPKEPEPPLPPSAPRATGPPASTIPSPGCVLVRFHSLDDIVSGISRGDAIEYTQVDTLSALPETMTIRERRPSLMRSLIPGESWQVTRVSMISHRTPADQQNRAISITCDREGKTTSVAYVAICGGGCCCCMDVGLSCGIAGSDDCAIHRWSAAGGLWQNPSVLILSRGLGLILARCECIPMRRLQRRRRR